MRRSFMKNPPPLGYIVAIVVIAAATTVLRVFGGRVNPTTAALSLLLIVLFLAAAWGPKPAVLASLLAAACFNFFFLPPVGTFHIAHPENWIALLAFLVTAITAGQLSAHARRRAEEADSARQEIERLYQELQNSFEQASQAKAIKQSERLKSALLDAVTHDLRTPLTSIKASVTTLLDDQRSPTADKAASRLDEEGRQEMLEIINEESDRLDRFIDGLMELARIEAGELHLRRHRASLNEIAAAAIKRAKPRTRLHNIELKVDRELPSVNVDGPALVEVIYVLLDNAAKYSPPGSTVTVSATTSRDGEVCLVVEDQGSGIPPDLRERVFTKFFRAMGDGGEQKPSGTGMGLAIAQGIVEAHGGRIWNEDGAAGRGTRFIVALPMDLGGIENEEQDTNRKNVNN
jgi:two-component system sensor histidine kinase KdpD